MSSGKEHQTASQVAKISKNNEHDAVTPLHVVVFTGGRGSSAISNQLTEVAGIKLQYIVNGYDNGMSTGEIRRFLDDSLGPSDFRKNASRLALLLESCSRELVSLLDSRFPDLCGEEQAISYLNSLDVVKDLGDTKFERAFVQNLNVLPVKTRNSLMAMAKQFISFKNKSTRTFKFSDCSLGNIIFAGCYLKQNNNFNAAVADYCALLGLPEDMILNITDGKNAFLIAKNTDGEILQGEEDIVDANRRNKIDDIYLLSRTDAAKLGKLKALKDTTLKLNAKVEECLSSADLIVYSPGTQHSSLFPSYMTPGLGECIAANTKALKLLITNIHEDAEIAGADATDIIRKASYYLQEKNKKPLPEPTLITHYIINRPGKTGTSGNYILEGELERIEDPRLVRISNFEDGASGQHDSGKVLLPFINMARDQKRKTRVAVVCLDTSSINKIAQTVREMQRAKISLYPCEVTVVYSSNREISDSLVADDNLHLHHIPPSTAGESNNQQLLGEALALQPDFVCLFESSGMYFGGDIVALVSNLNQNRVDAVWGSRRLSRSDIRESYSYRYRSHLLKGGISYLGSHLLSLAHLICYGRYISDTLSGLKLIKSAHLEGSADWIDNPSANQYLLARLVRSDGRLFEVPVDFLPMSPNQVARTGPLDGLRALGVIFAERFRSIFRSKL
jgi:2-phospho-L-lactate transferase/gluconeogenesis factor (CofD/UPF0052 family)